MPTKTKKEIIESNTMIGSATPMNTNEDNICDFLPTNVVYKISLYFFALQYSSKKASMRSNGMFSRCDISKTNCRFCRMTKSSKAFMVLRRARLCSRSIAFPPNKSPRCERGDAINFFFKNTPRSQEGV